MIFTTLQNYGLEANYRGHQFHGDYPLIQLGGSAQLDALLDNIHFQDSAFYLGTYPELWSGETVSFKSAGSVTVIEAVDEELRTLMTYHITRMAQEIQRCLKNTPQQEETDTQDEIEVMNGCEEVVYIDGIPELRLPF